MFLSELHRPGIALVASKEGSVVEAIIHATQDGRLDADVTTVVTNNENAGVLTRVERLNAQYHLDIVPHIINSVLFPGGRQERGQTLAEAAEMCRVISASGARLTILAGFFHIMPEQGEFMQNYCWRPAYAEQDNENLGIYHEKARTLNLHPGILPATADTWGIRTQEKALSEGLTVTCHTVQMAAPKVDEGPVISSSEAIAIYADDTPETLQKRVRHVEPAHTVQAIRSYLHNRQVRGVL